MCSSSQIISGHRFTLGSCLVFDELKEIHDLITGLLVLKSHYLRKWVVGFLQNLFSPFVLDAVNAGLDLLWAARWKDALKPLDIDDVTVFKTWLLFNNRKLFNVSPTESQSSHATEKTM